MYSHSAQQRHTFMLRIITHQHTQNNVPSLTRIVNITTISDVQAAQGKPLIIE